MFQPDVAKAAEIEAILNWVLLLDRWKRAESGHISGQPIFKHARLLADGVRRCAWGFAHQVAARVDSACISRQVTRMEEAGES